MRGKLKAESVSGSTFANVLGELLEESGESYREVAAKVGIAHSSFSKWVSGEVRPNRDTCIALADHFGINPNKVLKAAGYEPLRFFDRRKIDLSRVSPEGKEILEKMEQITDPKVRKRLFEVIDVMLDGYLFAEQEELVQIEAKSWLATGLEPAGSS